jgi:L-asparagine transporter-like permease
MALDAIISVVASVLSVLLLIYAFTDLAALAYRVRNPAQRRLAHFPVLVITGVGFLGVARLLDMLSYMGMQSKALVGVFDVFALFFLLLAVYIHLKRAAAPYM